MRSKSLNGTRTVGCVISNLRRTWVPRVVPSMPFLRSRVRPYTLLQSNRRKEEYVWTALLRNRFNHVSFASETWSLPDVADVSLSITVLGWSSNIWISNSWSHWHQSWLTYLLENQGQRYLLPGILQPDCSFFESGRKLDLPTLSLPQMQNHVLRFQTRMSPNLNLHTWWSKAFVWNLSVTKDNVLRLNFRMSQYDMHQ